MFVFLFALSPDREYNVTLSLQTRFAQTEVYPKPIPSTCIGSILLEIDHRQFTGLVSCVLTHH